MSFSTDNGHTMAKSLILFNPNSNSNPKLMKNMDKGLTVPKWVMINWQKIPQKAIKFGISMKKGFIRHP